MGGGQGNRGGKQTHVTGVFHQLTRDGVVVLKLQDANGAMALPRRMMPSDAREGLTYFVSVRVKQMPDELASRKIA